MNIQFDCADKINGLMTLTVEPADYQPKVEKTLKDYRKRANVPGFRPGMVPMSLIKRQYGTAVKVEEVNRLVSDALFGYIREHQIHMLGEPLPNEEQQVPQDFAKDEPLTFVFDIAVAPEVKAALSADDTIDYYVVEADDKLLDEQVQMYASQAGQFVEAQEWTGNDTLRGDIRQLYAQGGTLEGGITTEDASIMPSYITDEEQKKLFDGAKPGDIIVFNPKKAYAGNDAEVAGLLKVDKQQVADLDSDFSFQITTIRHFQPADVDQKLFDQVFGEGTCTSEADFRKKIAETIAPQLQMNGDYRFLSDLRKYLEEKAGEVEFPEALLRRLLKQNNPDKDDAYIEENFAGSLRELKWHLIKEQLVEAFAIKISDDDLKALAIDAVRQQFAQYGMSNVPDDILEKYATEHLQKRDQQERFVDQAVDQRIIQVAKAVVMLSKKTVTLDEFRKLMDAQAQ